MSACHLNGACVLWRRRRLDWILLWGFTNLLFGDELQPLVLFGDAKVIWEGQRLLPIILRRLAHVPVTWVCVASRILGSKSQLHFPYGLVRHHFNFSGEAHCTVNYDIASYL